MPQVNLASLLPEWTPALSDSLLLVKFCQTTDTQETLKEAAEILTARPWKVVHVVQQTTETWTNPIACS